MGRSLDGPVVSSSSDDNIHDLYIQKMNIRKIQFVPTIVPTSEYSYAVKNER